MSQALDPGGSAATLNLSTGQGNDTTTVNQVGAGITLNVHGQNGLDSLSVPAAAAQLIAGVLSVDNVGDSTVFTVDDSADSSARTVTLDTFTNGSDPNWEQITGLTPGPIQYRGIDVTAPTIIGGSHGNTFNVLHTTSFFTGAPTKTLTLDTGIGADTVNVQSNASNSTILIDGQGSNDTVNLGNAGNMQGIAGPVQIQNHPSFTAITADDSADTTARTVTLDTFVSGGHTWQSISGLAPGLISYDGRDSCAPTLRGGSGGNTFNVLHTAPFFANDVLTLGTGGGSDVVNLQSTAANSTLLIDGQGGLDAANLGNAGSTQGIAGPVQIQNHPFFTAVTADDSADTTARTVTLDTFVNGSDTWQSVAGLAPGLISYDGNDVTAPTILGGTGGNTFNVVHVAPFSSVASSKVLTLNTGTGTDTVHVQSTAANSTLDINGNNGPDSVNITNAGSLAGIAGPVKVENTSSFTLLTVDDTADTTARTAVLSRFLDGGSPWGNLTGLGAADISFKYNDSNGLTLLTGNAVNTVNVLSTGGIGPTSIVGRAFTNVNVGDAGSVQNIAALLKLTNPPSFDSITVDDSADATARNVTISSLDQPDLQPLGVVSGLARAMIEFRALDATSPVVINGGSGGNTFTVASTPLNQDGGTGGPTIQLNTGAGADTVLVNGNSGQLVINGQAGGDSVTVDLSGAAINANVSVNGGPGADTLVVKGAAPGDPFTVTATTITHGTITVGYVNAESLVLDPGAYTVTADLSGMNVQITGAGTTANFAVTQHLQNLAIDGGTVATLATSPSPVGKTLFCTGLSIAPTGKLDLTNNALQWNYGAGPDPIATVRGWVSSGYNGGTWNGGGINSSSANATHGVGFGDSADGIVSGLAAHTILVRYTRYGDVNLDGSVAFADLLALAQHYGQSGRNWDQGDMTYDGNIAFADLLKLAQNYGGLASVGEAAAFAPLTAAVSIDATRRRK